MALSKIKPMFGIPGTRRIWEYTNEDKAIVVYSLFRDEIVRCFSYQRKMYQRIWDDREGLAANWPKGHIMSAEAYYTMAHALAQTCEDAQSALAYGGSKLLAGPEAYSQLYGGMFAVVSNHALQRYAMQENATRKFQSCVALLWDFDPLRIRLEEHLKAFERDLSLNAEHQNMPLGAIQWLEDAAGNLRNILDNKSTIATKDNQK